MELDDLLTGKCPPENVVDNMGKEELVRFIWKYRGVLKEQKRERAFWTSTNENLKMAYKKLYLKEQELQQAYTLIQQDLEAARQIQQAFRPGISWQLNKNLDLAVYHKQLRPVGGDYYDIFRTKNNNYAIAMFDICGHGVSAALIMAYLKAQFLQTMKTIESPREIIEHVNSISLAYLRRIKKYSAVTFILFDKEMIRYVCGGGYGILISEGHAHQLQKGDNFLGLRDNPFHEYTHCFSTSDILVLFTDGIIESRNKSKEAYSCGRLIWLIKQYSDRHVKEILDICIEDYRNFRDKDVDDITLIILRKKGGN